MKRKISLLLLLICSSVIAHAQTFSLKGRLMSGKNIVDYANIVLQKSDSTFVTGVNSDKTGRFRIEEVQKDKYRLNISCIGYEGKSILLNISEHSIDLGDIQLASATHQLQEVVVKASRIIRTPEKQISMPTKYQIKASTNGLELLRSMQLSRLHVDMVNNKITSSAQGEVQLRINGAKVDIHQVQALRPEDIQRVEYHDDPGLKYGEGVACVIDYITKRPISGGDISLEMRHSPSGGFDNDNLSASYNKGKSQFSLYLFNSYRNLHQWRTNTETFNFADGTSFTRLEDGKPNKIGLDDFYGNLSYNYQEGDKWYLNVMFSNGYDMQRVNTHSQLYSQTDINNSVNMFDYNHTTSNRPWLDIYFQRNFSSRRSFIFNVVGTYIHSTNERNYKEENQDVKLTEINSLSTGNKYSIITEAIYSVGIGKSSTLNIGMSGNQAYTVNDYSGTVVATTNMHDGYARGFAEWKQQLGKFNYSLGTNLSYIWMLQGTNRLHNTMMYPKLAMGYTFNDHSFMRLSGERSYSTPDLSNISNVEQIIDSLQIRRGNPNLKVSHTWMTNLYYEWRKGVFGISANLFYMYQNHPVMEETLLENNKFIRTTMNQDSWQKVNPEVQLQVGPLFNLLTLSATGGMNYFDSHGIDYHHYYTNWYYQLDATAQYKRVTVMLQVNNHKNDFYGETCTYGESYHLMMARYKVKDMSFGVFVLNPFVGRDSYKLPVKNYSKYAPSSKTMYIRESARMVALTFNWNFSVGRKYQAPSKQLSNEDKETGTMNSGK